MSICRNIVTILICALVSLHISAQNSHWQSITTNPYQYWVQTFYEDTSSNLLYIGGGATSGRGVLVYDGNNVTPLGSCYPGCARGAIIKYNDTIWAGGNCAYGQGLMKWNGSIWDTSGHVVDGPVSSFFIFNNELYVGGMFTTIAGMPATGFAKFDGTHWTVINPPFSSFIAVNCISAYNGELYIAGQFTSPLGNNILRWNGSQWNSVGTGFFGGMDEVARMEIYNNNLYIAGMFHVADGNVGNYIAKWDGTSLSDVGGGVMGANNTNGQIDDLKTFNNSLYAVGVFVNAGGVYTSYIAKWDGVNWCSLGDTFNVPISALGTYRGELYIGGGWWQIGNDTISGVAKWIGGNYVDSCGNLTGVIESNRLTGQVSFFPNPVTNSATIMIKNNQGKKIVEVFDVFGREIWRKETEENIVEFSSDGIPPGLYFYKVECGELRSTGKFVVEKAQ